MNIYNPIEFRNHLFDALETVQKGKMIYIKTRKENLYIISEKHIDSTPNFKLLTFDRPALVESVKLDSHIDPFDRIIIVTAQAYKLRLLTKDLRILKLFPKLTI